MLATFVFITAIFCCSGTQFKKHHSRFFHGTPKNPYHGTTFSEAFNHVLASNDKLLKQFNVSIPQKESYKLNQQLAYDFYSKLHVKNPSKTADAIAEVSQYKFQGLSPKDMVNMVISSVETILKQQDVLNEENTVPLALKLAHYFDSLRDSPGYDGSPEANLTTLFYGVLRFLLDVVPSSPNNGKFISEVFEKNINALPDTISRMHVSEDISLDVEVDAEIN